MRVELDFRFQLKDKEPLKPEIHVNNIHEILGPGLLCQFSDSLLPGRYGVRTPVREKRFLFSISVHTGPWDPPTFSSMGKGKSRM